MALLTLTQQQIKDDPEQQIRNFKRTKDFLVAIDTDGCVTNNMNGKQMVIFHPHYMGFYDLWEIESYFREIAEYYNLFSIHRGCNRFLAVQYTLNSLYERADVRKIVREKNIPLPGKEMLDDYIEFCVEYNWGLGNPSLEKFIELHSLNFELYKLLGWSEAVNRTFPFINPKIPPFSNVKNSLTAMNEYADVVVVSQTPYNDLVSYWETQKLSQYISIIVSQEMGTKLHHIEVIKNVCDYDDENILMLGDGDSDLKAVQKSNGLFYPILPGFEEDSWNKFSEYFKIFIEGGYKGEIQEKLLTNFSKVFLKKPKWEEPEYDHITAYKEKQEIRKSLYEKLNPNGRLLIL
ncbi:MAG: hypothetical protein M1501_01650 [Candidatus Omnitrophica bacterium]|nr:hypothetical protein [Candidatus Omnitrophota bacterium]